MDTGGSGDLSGAIFTLQSAPAVLTGFSSPQCWSGSDVGRNRFPVV